MNDIVPVLREPVVARRITPLPPTIDRVDGLRRAMAALRRRWWLALVMFAGVLAIVLSFGLTRTKLYTATANMVVNSRELNVSEKDKEVLPGLSTAENAADTEVQIMRSMAVAEGTVKALNLANNPLFGKKLEKLPAPVRETAAAAILETSLKVDRPGQSNVVSIAYTAADPILAKSVADEVGRQYLAVKGESRHAAVQNVDQGLGDELERLRGQLEQAEAAIADYRAKNSLFATQNTTFTEQELSTYKQQEAQSRANLAEANARLATAEAQISRGSNGGDVGAALQSPVVQQLRAQRATVAATYADLSSRYRPDHPDLVKVKQQLDSIDSQINAEIERQIANLRANAQVARDQAGNAAGTVAQTSGTLAANNAASVKLNELQRKADGLRDTYQTLLTRRNSISSQALVADEDARIFSPAALPLRPSSPNKPLIVLLGIALAAIVSAASVWIAEAFDRKLVTSGDVESKLGLPHIANVPEIRSIARGQEARIAAIDFALARPASLYAESLRAIRLAALRHKRHDGPLTVGITSARPGEGKTTMAISLARVSAMAGSRTLLIDADVRRPAVATALGFTPRHGLVELLRDNLPLEAALIRDEASGAMILPIAQAVGGSHDLFDAAHLQQLRAALGNRFDMVIFDAAPALAVADARLLLRQLDDVVMVVRWNDTPRQTAAAALKRMRALDIEPMGVVTTRVNMRALAAYGHGDIDRDHAAYGVYYS
jgi:capsular exopolysaccharide synthesis family protein